jgi:hypothetical protein
MDNKDKESSKFNASRFFMTMLVVGVLGAVVAFNYSGAEKVASIIGIPELQHALAVLAIASGVVLFFVRNNSLTGIFLKLFAHGISYGFLVVAIYSGMADNKIDSAVSANGASNSSVKIENIERILKNNLTKDERVLVENEIKSMKLEVAYNSKGKSLNKTIYSVTSECSPDDVDSKNYKNFCEELHDKEASLLLFSDKTRIQLLAEKDSLRESSSVQQSSSEKTDKFGTLLASNGVSADKKDKVLNITAMIVGGILEVFIFMVIAYWQQEKESDEHKSTAIPPSSTVQQTSSKRLANKIEKKSGVLGKVARAAAEYQAAREEAKKSQQEMQKDRDMSLNVARAIMAVDGAALIGVISAKFLPNAEKHRTDKMRVCVCVAACLWEFVDEKTNEFKLQNGDGYISQNEFVDKVIDRHKKTMITRNDRGGEDRYMTYGMFKNWIVPIMVDDLKVWRREESTGKIFQRRETEVMVFLSNAMKRKGALKSVA